MLPSQGINQGFAYAIPKQQNGVRSKGIYRCVYFGPSKTAHAEAVSGSAPWRKSW